MMSRGGSSSPSTARRAVGYGRLVAPIVMILFVVGWYEFSAIYILGADNQLVASGNLSVYVTVQQLLGYMSALLYATYVTIVAGALAFSYNLLKFLRDRKIATRRG